MSGRRHARSLGLLVVALALAVLAACDRARDGGDDPTRVPVPAGRYNDIAWVGDDVFVVTHDGALVKANVSDGDVQPVALPDRDGCRRTDYERPARMPDGRVGLVVICFLAAGDPSGLVSRNTYVAVDLESMAVTD